MELLKRVCNPGEWLIQYSIINLNTYIFHGVERFPRYRKKFMHIKIELKTK